MKNVLIIIAMFCLSSNAHAQPKIVNRSYHAFLKLLVDNNVVKDLSVSEALAKREAVFIDARERSEYDVSHIQNAVFIGYKDFSLARFIDIPKNREMIIYCSVGKRSENISLRLIKAGFTNVYNLYGGIFEWVNQGQPLVDLSNKRTNKVHAYGRFWGKWLSKGEKVYN